MSRTAFQRGLIGGERISLFMGLAETVSSVIRKLPEVEGVSCIAVRSYRGEPKVKMSWGGGKDFVVMVCDAEYGERHLRVATKKHGATSRILRQKFERDGISIHRNKITAPFAA